MVSTHYKASLIALAVAIASAAFGQEQLAEKKKLYVVFSGGSQLAWSFIPILKWADDNHVKIDAIGGSSGGSLVAAFYQQGLSADEMVAYLRYISNGRQDSDWVQGKILANQGEMTANSHPVAQRPLPDWHQRQNWSLVLGNNVKYDNLNLSQKQIAQKYQAFYAEGSAGPAPLSYGPQIGILLSRAALGHLRGEKFDEGGIQFANVGVNLATAPPQAFVAAGGSLPVALRSTMAIPARFASIPFTDTDVSGLSDQGVNTFGVSSDGGILDVFPTIRLSKTFKKGSSLTMEESNEETTAADGYEVLGANVQPKSFKASKQTEQEIRNSAKKVGSLSGNLDKGLKAIGGEQTYKNEKFADSNGVLLNMDTGEGSFWSDIESLVHGGERTLELRKSDLDGLALRHKRDSQEEVEFVNFREALKNARSFSLNKVRVRFVRNDASEVTSGTFIQHLQNRFNKFGLGRKYSQIDAKDLTKPSETLSALEQQIEEMIGEERFMFALYEKSRPEDGAQGGSYDILVTFYERGAGARPSSYGLNVDSHPGSRTLADIRGTRVSLDRLGYGSSIRYQLGLGSVSGGSIQVDKPVSHGDVTKLWRASIGYSTSDRTRFTQGSANIAGSTENDTSARIRAGLLVNKSRFAQFNLGFEASQLFRRTVIGGSTTGSAPDFRTRNIGVFGSVLYDQTNQPNMPTRGARGSFTFGNFRQNVWDSQNGSSGSANKWSYEAKALAHVWLDKFDGAVFVSGRYGKQARGTLLQEFFLGGPYALGSLLRDQWRGNEYQYYSIGIRKPIGYGDDLILHRRDILAFLDHGEMRLGGVPTSKATNLNVGYQIDTLLGVGEFMLSMDRPSRFKLSFGLGQRF